MTAINILFYFRTRARESVSGTGPAPLARGGGGGSIDGARDLLARLHTCAYTMQIVLDSHPALLSPIRRGVCVANRLGRVCCRLYACVPIQRLASIGDVVVGRRSCMEDARRVVVGGAAALDLSARDSGGVLERQSATIVGA